MAAGDDRRPVAAHRDWISCSRRCCWPTAPDTTRAASSLRLPARPPSGTLMRASPSTCSPSLDHRSLNVTCGYRVGEERCRDAIDKVTAMHRPARQPIWRRPRALDSTPHAVGSVAVPYGRCTEPPTRPAGGACPIRSAALTVITCTDVSRLLTSPPTSMICCAPGNDLPPPSTASTNGPAPTPPPPRRRSPGSGGSSVGSKATSPPDAERAQVDEAVTVIRKHRAVSSACYRAHDPAGKALA